MKTGIVSATFRNKTTDEVIEISRSVGLDAIEWSGDIHVPPNDLENAKKVGVKTRKSGILTPSYGSYYRLGHSECDFSTELATALALGASNIRVWAGKKGSKETDIDYKNAIYEDAKRIVDIAKKEGVTVSLEYHQNTLTDTASSTDELLKNVENLYAYWQFQPTRDEKTNLNDLAQLGDRLTSIHVQNISAPYWNTYLNYLKTQKSNRLFLIEFVKDNSDEQFVNDAKLLHTLLK